MFKNILTANQLKLLPLVREFSADFVVQAVSDEEIKQFLTDIATAPF